MKRIGIVLTGIVLLLAGGAAAQPGMLTIGELVDLPVAHPLPAGDIDLSLRMYPRGGLLASVMVGLSDRFSLGASYGGENIIGAGRANFNPQPCVHVRYLFFRERSLFPAISIGFDSQGFGGYIRELKRYAVKSRGFYAVVSKNTSFLGGLGMHAGVSYSVEDEDGDTDPDLFFGAHKHINEELVILAEYDTAINDNSDNAIGSGKGYLNCALRWSFAQRLFVEFAWKNILENNETVVGSSREIKLIYKSFL
ncbi:hypothetical protein JXO52_01115 [bacterium]|nr:hypothetical protein [bacterium]